ncbi:MAG TPA: glycoside hydrolase family 25 protein [Vicinamibacterales bacterium]|nr:glycoside hydrolase family 25 protein [Vicinamibacterales bacterium]
MVNAVVDISHHNGRVNFVRAKADGIVGVIHKSTQGRTYVDPVYRTNRTKAKDAGMLWGAYHFGTGSDGVRQAEHLLDTVQPESDTLLVLDLEANPQGPNMSLEEARAFVTHVKEGTGRYPGLYSGHYIKALLGSHQDAVLSQCWFWLAQYGPTAVVPVNWPTWTMWQYTDGGLGPEPHTVTGIGRCDRDRFNGTKAALHLLWTAAP